jgi:hypothetical protein
VKWLQILWQQLVRDVLLPGLGAWVVYKQVYAAVPNPYLLAFAAGCFWPAARFALTTILSGPGASSESPAPPGEPSSPSSRPGGGTGERG